MKGLSAFAAACYYYFCVAVVSPTVSFSLSFGSNSGRMLTSRALSPRFLCETSTSMAKKDGNLSVDETKPSRLSTAPCRGARLSSAHRRNALDDRVGSSTPRISRRDALGHVLQSATIVSAAFAAVEYHTLVASAASASSSSSSSSSSSFRKPYAPIEALVPVTRKRLALNRCMGLVSEIVQLTKEQEKSNGNELRKQKIDAILMELEQILELPSNSQSRGGGNILPSNNIPFRAFTKTKRYPTDNENTRQKGLSNTLSGSGVRAAMNVYTSNLRFADTYVLTASDDARSAYIRKYDGLPDVRQVVASDLDLRDLYRNDVQTKIEDASAEFQYQLDNWRSGGRGGKNNNDKDETDDGDMYYGSNASVFDCTELLSILQSASNTCDKWFGLISEDDIRAAEVVIAKESNRRDVGKNEEDFQSKLQKQQAMRQIGL